MTSAAACSSCDYCMPCSYGIDIPALLVFDTEHAKDPESRYLARYLRRFPRLRRADHCIECGVCMLQCPQGIDIAGEMRRIDAKVERIRSKD